MNKALFRNLALLLLPTLSVTAPLTAQAEVTATKTIAYPTYTADYYNKDGQFDSKYFGKLGAIKGIIKQIKPGPNGKPILQLQLDQPKKTIWVASMYKAPTEHFSVSQSIKVFGLFDQTELETKYIAKLTKQPEYILAFCLYTNPKQMPLYLTKRLEKCLQWEQGDNSALKLVTDVAPNSKK